MVAKATFTEKVEQFATNIVENKLGESSFSETAKKIESMRKYKIKDYDSALSHFLQEQLSLYQQKESNGMVINKTTIETLEVAKKLLETVKEIRRENNRQISKVDTNILTASPFFVGGSRELKKEGKEKGYITFEQGGLRKLTYHNEQGRLLTYNDAKTLFALFALWEDQGQDGYISFTEYQLLNKMNMLDGGNQYKILRESLEKLRSTSVVLQEAYDIESGQRFVTERFPLIIANKFTIDKDNNGNVRSKLYEIQLSPLIYKSMQNGYYSLISLALWDEIETDSGKGIYSMISGICNMESNSEYIREDGSYELPAKLVYDQLKLERPKPSQSKLTVENACQELKNIEIIDEFYFKSEGKRNVVKSLVIKPSNWLIDILSRSKNNSIGGTRQLKLQLDETL